jgi:hypothetical protein
LQLFAHPDCQRFFIQQNEAYLREQEQIRIEYLEDELRKLQKGRYI